jgi:arylsulfatase
VTFRFQWFRLAVLVTATFVGSTVALGAQRVTRPNIIVIWLTTWDGRTSVHMEVVHPNLDAFAARGVRFTQFYSTPRCPPTRASL